MQRPDRSPEIPRRLGTSAIAPSGDRETAFTLSEAEQEAFNRAGWLFVRPSAELARAVESRQTPQQVAFIGRVFRHSDGHLEIGTDRLTVKLQPQLSQSEVQSALAAANLEVVRELKFAPYLYEVRVGAGSDPLDVAVALHENPAFIYAEPQMLRHLPQRFTPTDPDYSEQWQWHNDGSNGGTVGADIDAEAAWDFTRGAGVRVAVIDNGIDVNHPDLAPAIAAGAAYFQDDGMAGANFVLGLTGFPDSNHGTFCSGMAIARANNSEGGCGAANEADFLPVACLADQVGTQATLARAVAYAADPTTENAAANADDGADVISCSLGPNDSPWQLESVLDDAINFAIASGRGGRGTPIFWAVDNSPNPIANDEVCSHPGVIAVGRSTRNDTEDGSAFGPKLEFLAPGVDVYSTTSGSGYGTSTGTSFAAPTAAGVGALLLAVNPELTRDEVVEIMRDTCEKVGGVAYGVDGHHDNYGFGRVNAAQAVCSAGWIVELLTPAVTFNDVPEGETTVRAIVFEVLSCRSVQFQIVSGPTTLTGPADSFGTPLGTSVSLGSTTDFTAPRTARLWISYTGSSAGDTATGTVTVRCVETGEEWVIPLSANTIARPTVAVELVLDKSGSMDSDGGDGRTRLQILKDSAPVFADVIQAQNALGIVSFDQDAYDVMPVTPAGPDSFGAGRTAAKAAISAHATNPTGTTSIGDGVALAHTRLEAVAGYDVKATIVLTDGQENTPQYIADVMGVINERVYAIGLGTPEAINPIALNALTNGTGGYLLMTGILDADDYFRLSKYYLQILAGVTNSDIVLDPEGWIYPGQVHRIPFRLTETDISSEVILLTPAPRALRFALETPSGEIIDPAAAGSNPAVSYVVGDRVSFYRLTLPVPVGGNEAREGTWHAVLSFDDIAIPIVQVAASQNRGVRYSLNVHSYSNLRLRTSLSQNSREPGALLTLRAILTEYDLPVESRAKVVTELERPDKTTATLELFEIEPGVFETSTAAAISGIYNFRVLANGRTLRSRAFTREQLRTGAVWIGGDAPLPSSKDDQNQCCRSTLPLLKWGVGLLGVLVFLALLLLWVALRHSFG